MKSKTAAACPCGSGKHYPDCCEPYISGKFNAPDAEALMRSRYTAYTLKDEAYLQRTWHPTTRPTNVLNESLCRWIGLTVLAYHPNQQNATVEFIAKYKLNGRAQKMHELSRFIFQGGQWLYVDGDFLDD